jgi:menaquinol-cytochrome c reductase cytochrome b/c subunit
MTEKPKFELAADSDALRSPQRVVFITKNTSAKVKYTGEPRLMSFPHLLLREAMAFQILAIVLVVLALFWDAPLEQLANPLLTPNPAKAPWYFLGLQELLHYFPPIFAGVLIPGLVVIALVVIPYFEINVKGQPYWADKSPWRFRITAAAVATVLVFLTFYRAWTVLVPTALVAMPFLALYFAPAGKGQRTDSLRSRPLSWWVMTWFISVAIVLTIVGTFFRGPGWSWVRPWR